MDLGEKIRFRREAMNMSQEELARRMGYKSRSSINKIENGRPVSQKIIFRLAEVLDTTPAYLMGWNEEKPTAEDSGLSRRKKEFLERVMLMSDAELDRLDQILRLVEDK